MIHLEVGFSHVVSIAVNGSVRKWRQCLAGMWLSCCFSASRSSAQVVALRVSREREKEGGMQLVESLETIVSSDV